MYQNQCRLLSCHDRYGVMAASTLLEQRREPDLFAAGILNKGEYSYPGMAQIIE